MGCNFGHNVRQRERAEAYGGSDAKVRRGTFGGTLAGKGPLTTPRVKSEGKHGKPTRPCDPWPEPFTRRMLRPGEVAGLPTRPYPTYPRHPLQHLHGGEWWLFDPGLQERTANDSCCRDENVAFELASMRTATFPSKYTTARSR